MLDPYWVTGFVDGEGSFTFQDHQPSFGIKLRLDDINVIEKIREFFKGVGKLYTFRDKNPSAKSYMPNRKPIVYYRITKRRDLKNIIIPHFDQYPLISRKKEVYEAWKEFVLTGDRKIMEKIKKLKEFSLENVDKTKWPR